MAGAKEVIERLRLDSKNYRIERRSSHPDLVVEGHKVGEFLILHIEDLTENKVDDIPF